jgi:two-component system, sensor histidine kinase and response regulator
MMALRMDNSAKAAEAIQKRQKLIIFFISTFSLMLLLFAAFLFYYYSQKKKSAQRLAELNSLLSTEQENLKRKNEKLNRFSSVVTHDILSNLDLILSSGNVLVSARAQPKRLEQYYDMTQRTSKQLKAYCIALLEEARQTHERAADVLPLQNPMPVLHTVLERYEPELKSNNFRVDVQPLSPVSLPLAQVEQLFQNLVSNAIRYAGTAAAPMLHISATTDAQGRPCWVVEDTGPGMPEAQMATIFQGRQTSGKGTGQGIGLSLLRQSLNEYGADIRVEERPGGGARFVITF